MDRRYFIRTVGVAAVAGATGLAGCANDGGGGQNDGGDTPTQTSKNIPTATPTPTQQTPTGTAPGTATGTATGDDGTGQPTTHTVGMYTKNGSYYFDPIGLYVKPGDTVRWVIKNGSHSTTSYSQGNPQAKKTLIPDGADGWNSGTISSGSFKHTFTVKGTYDYYCIPHKTLGMVARIVCGEPGGPATKQPIPNKVKKGSVPPSKVIVKKKTIPYPYTSG